MAAPNFTPIPINFYNRVVTEETVPQLDQYLENVDVPGTQRTQTNSAAGIDLQSLSNGFNGENLDSGPTIIVNSEPTTTEYSPVVDPSTSRLNNNGLPYGGSYESGQIQPTNQSGISSAVSSDIATPGGTGGKGNDKRVKIRDETGTMSPSLVIFPFTPVITVSHRANYEIENLIHSTYSTPYYTHSSVDNINIQGRFTAQNEYEAIKIRDMIQFFRTATKMFYGASTPKGAPPPVVKLEGYGDLFEKIPVVVRDFSYTLPNDVNYISLENTSIPTDMSITIDLLPVYSRNKIAGFDIKSYAAKESGWI